MKKNNKVLHTLAEHLTIGARIALRCRDVGCSHYDIAKCCNVTERTVYNWCKSKSIPELRYIPSLCFILHSQISWLVTGRMDKYQWVDEFPIGFFDFLVSIRNVNLAIENRGDVLRSVFEMAMTLHFSINNSAHKKHNFNCFVDKEPTHKVHKFKCFMNRVTTNSPFHHVEEVKHGVQENLTFSGRFNIRKLELGLSNKGISLFCGVSEKTVYNWGKGKSLPTIMQFPALCSILDADMSWLVTGCCDLPQWLGMTPTELKVMLDNLNRLPSRTVNQIYLSVSVIVHELDTIN
ncbi:XRE family transcriptional regulator [Moritella sp. 5]|uniref:XRE family transcriptional regulator n=1 Tax=Moritella sp. 5 TaxID=2746231 RepID=UPI001BA53303|nr:XRE family transcriptional regulator [Moritella sp. 5]QUM79606.1 XRE family transcriptional regulator [Moritella sp. 5]